VAQKSITTGTCIERCRTSASKLASVTSSTWAPLLVAAAPALAGPRAGAGVGGRSADRSTAPAMLMSVGLVCMPPSCLTAAIGRDQKRGGSV